MRSYFGFIEANSPILSAKLNHEIMVLSGVVTFTVLSFCVFISINHFKSKKIKEKTLPLIADQSGESSPERGDPDDPMLMAFVEDLVASAQSKSVPLAPLQTLLAKLIDSGVSDAEIPNRLLVAAEQLEALRASLANWHDAEDQDMSKSVRKPWRVSTAAISIPRARCSGGAGRRAGCFPRRHATKKPNPTQK